MRQRQRILMLPMLLAVLAGLATGIAAPAMAVQLRILSEVFIRLLGWLMCPLVFCMLVGGVASFRSHRTAGRTGLIMLLYFGAMSVLSMLAGLLTGWIANPGATLTAQTAQDAFMAPPAHAAAEVAGWLARLPALHANNLVLLLLALPVGLAMGWRGRAPSLDLIERCRSRLLALVKLVLWCSPLAAFGAVASTVGRSGLMSLEPLLRFVVAINLGSAAFILIAYGAVAWLARVSLRRLLYYLRDELLLVVFTGSSLAALPPLSKKLEQLGCPRRLVDVVLPFSYSLNLAGTYLYIAMALVFLAQVAQVRLGWHDLAVMLGVGLLSSKGAVGVAGSALATLAATATLLHIIPPDMIAMLIAIDRTMKCRLLTNVIGHGLACVFLATRDGSLDRDALASQLAAPPASTQQA